MYKVLVKQAELLLGEAVLDTLYQKYCEDEDNYVGLGPADISRAIGAYRKQGAAGKNDAIVSGILDKLLDEGRVEHVPRTAEDGGRWKLSQTEIDARTQR